MKMVIILLSTVLLFAKGPTGDSIKAVVSKSYDIDKQHIDVRNLKGVGKNQLYLVEIDNASNNKSYSIVNIGGIETSISEMKSSPLGVYSYTYIYNSEALNAIGDFFKNHKDSENISDKKEFTLFKIGADNIKNFKINRITSANILINDNKYFSNNSQFIAPVFSYENKLTGFYIYKNKISEMDIMMQETNKLIDKEYITLDKIRNINSKTSPILSKSHLYKEPSKSSLSKMYLIPGDKVTLLDTKTDEAGQEWYYISYQGKKEIKMWIKAEAVK